MAGRGVHFALTADEVDALRGCATDEMRLDVLTEEIEETLFEDHRDRVCETDKAWDAIHRSLTDGSLSDRESVSSLAVLGGESLYEEDDYIMALKTRDQVRRAVDALKPITREALRRAYDDIDPDVYAGELGDDDFEYTWTNFDELRGFFQRSADAGLYVLFSVDQ